MNIRGSLQQPPASPSTSHFAETVRAGRHEPLTAGGVKVLQVNLGNRCNMACTHCHVSAGPAGNDDMDGATAELVLAALRNSPIGALDITGGAPELNPHFRQLVRGARRSGKRVIARTNLTVFFEPGMTDLPEFYRDAGVELIASLPCYLEENIRAVRGDDAFRKSVDALRRLNALGFGASAGLSLSLVYNPGGPFLPPLQAGLEADYRRELQARYGISFTRLYTFTNMPIGRFRDALARTGRLDQYRALLASSFNAAALDSVMCRSLLSVGWDGRLADCDFNLVLGIPLAEGAPRHIREFDYERLAFRRIAVDDHCYGCTAGQGSS
jgi:radical SAM/Cys-rich protein